MRSVQNIFRAAGIFGLITILAQCFRLQADGTQIPSAYAHPEYYFGFLGLIAVFQILFLIVAHDPMRYRSLMPLCALEKVIYADSAAFLYYQHRLALPMFIAGAIELAWAILFAWAYYTTGHANAEAHRELFAYTKSRVTRMDHAAVRQELGRDSIRQ